MEGMLGAITGLIGAGLNASNQAAQVATEQAALQWQKQAFRDQMRFSQAGRSDAYGNKQKYNEGTNSWDINLTPMQNAIIKAGEREQYRGLTEDAQRNRQTRLMQFNRSNAAQQPYAEAVAGYRYDQPHTEDSIRNELETLQLQANQDTAKQNQDTLAREALRFGRGADIPRLIKATDDQLGSSVAMAMLQARQGAMGEHAQRLQSHEAQYAPQIQKWLSIMDDAGQGAPQNYSTTPQQLDQLQSQQAQAIQSAMQNGAAGVGGAYQNLAAAMGKPLDISALTKGLSNMGGSGSGGGKSKKVSQSITGAGANNDPFSIESGTGNPDQPWDANIGWGGVPNYFNDMNGAGAFSGWGDNYSGSGDFLF